MSAKETTRMLLVLSLQPSRASRAFWTPLPASEAHECHAARAPGSLTCLVVQNAQARCSPGQGVAHGQGRAEATGWQGTVAGAAHASVIADLIQLVEGIGAAGSAHGTHGGPCQARPVQVLPAASYKASAAGEGHQSGEPKLGQLLEVLWGSSVGHKRSEEVLGKHGLPISCCFLCQPNLDPTAALAAQLLLTTSRCCMDGSGGQAEPGSDTDFLEPGSDTAFLEQNRPPHASHGPTRGR